MPDTIKAGLGRIKAGSVRPELTLDTDGKPHPVQSALTAFTLLGGTLAFATGLIVVMHVFALVLGVAALVVGLYTQMISVARPQRVVLMAGVVAAFVGTCLAIAHGGFG